MRDFLNDLAHIAFACLIFGLPAFRWWGYIVSGVLLGWLIEAKEENSSVFKVPLKDLCFRDIIGYTLGGLICGLFSKFVTW